MRLMSDSPSVKEVSLVSLVSPDSGGGQHGVSGAVRSIGRGENEPGKATRGAGGCRPMMEPRRTGDRVGILLQYLAASRALGVPHVVTVAELHTTTSSASGGHVADM